MNYDQIIRQLICTYFVPIIRKAVREEIKQLKLNMQASTDEDEMLTAQQSAAFIGDALPTFYGRTSRGEIATYGSGKRIFCKKAELIGWKQKNRTKSKDQIKQEVAEELGRKR